jgi:CHAT domain-containing protein/tetratricopeptide (TPR) repeat protein
MRTAQAVVRILLVAVGGLVGAPAVKAQDRPAPQRPSPPPSPGDLATAVLAAFREGRTADLDRAARPEHDPRGFFRVTDQFRVAGVLFALAVRGGASDPPADADALAAAADYARRASSRQEAAALPELVAAWRALGPEDLARERRLLAALEGVRAAVAAKDLDGAVAAARAVREDRDRAPWSIAAHDLACQEGFALRDATKLREAADALLEAVRRSRELRWPVGRTGLEGACLHAAFLVRDLGELREAKALHEDELAVHRAADYRPGIYGILGNLGIVHARLGEPRRAQALYEEAWRGFEELGMLGAAILMRVNALQQMVIAGRAPEAVVGLEKIREEMRGRNVPWDEAHLLGALGFAHQRLGRYSQALGCHEQSLALYRKRGDRARVATALTHIGNAWKLAGDPERALRVLEQALREDLEMKRPWHAAMCHSSMGLVLLELERPAEAEPHFVEALSLFERAGTRLGPLPAILGHARARLDLGHPGEALEAFARGRDLAISLDEPNPVVVADRGAARALEDLGRLDEAMALYERLERDAEALGDSMSVAEAREGRTRILSRRGRWSEAVQAARATLRVRMQVVSGLDEELGGSLRSDARAASDLGLDACRPLAKREGAEGAAALEAALEFVEAGRAISLREAMTNRESLLQSVATPEIAALDASARARVQAAAAELRARAGRRAPPGEIAESRKRLDAAYEALRDVSASIRREAGAASAALEARPAAIAEIRDALGHGAALLLYNLGRSRSGVEGRATLVALDRTSLRLVDLGPSKELALAAEAWAALAGTEGTAESGPAAALYDALLRPVEDLLAGKERVVLSPDGALTLVPFEALLRSHADGSRRAIEDREFVYVPSGTVMAAIAAEARGRPAGSRLLAVADPEYPPPARGGPPSVASTAPRLVRWGEDLPPLPGTRAEVQAIEAWFPEDRRTLLLGGDATVAAVREALRRGSARFAAVHFACHGVLDVERPLLSGLSLAGGEALTVHDVQTMRVDADLAVLSACETARGRLAAGEGSIGLMRGFLLSGCPRVVVSGWKVRDADTAAFMEEFYRGMRKEGLSAAAALRRAKLARVRAKGEESHPSRWAAFTIWGLPQ